MEKQDIYARLPAALLDWYGRNKRDLPWRQDKDPYHIWLSEIMLQQTRVEAVKGYYRRFLQALPTVEALANADDELLSKLWEGLGYYSRVRNLKKAARIIAGEYGGVFPREYSQVLALPGIGAYTAGAICSIAFDLPTAAVDGNVMRLISRLTDDPTPIDQSAFQKQVRSSLAKVYPAEAGAFTQALMELGATVCGPNRPAQCALCPCADFCLGRKNGTAQSLPVKKAKAGRRTEQMTLLILRCGDRYGLRKRPEQGLLAGMWEFPHFPGLASVEAAIGYVESMGMKPTNIYRQVEKKHIFTHIQWDMSGVYMEVAEEGGALCWFTAEHIAAQTALPTAFRQFWEETDHV